MWLPHRPLLAFLLPSLPDSTRPPCWNDKALLLRVTDLFYQKRNRGSGGKATGAENVLELRIRACLATHSQQLAFSSSASRTVAGLSCLPKEAFPTLPQARAWSEVAGTLSTQTKFPSVSRLLCTMPSCT